MKNFIRLLTVAAMLFAVGCQKYNDKPLKNRVGELENRVATLEELCKKMNTNISSLQTLVNALQNNDYVTGVTPVTKNGETIGYTIAFSKSAPITIYHGENGKDGVDGSDGKDGVDGHTPIIGVRQGSDGIYYWTLDGEWLLDEAGNKIKAEGRDGQNGSDGKDGADGKDGINGSDGKDGANGITPQLKIENGYWFVSTDNGATWINLGKATGEDGKDGTDGIDGTNGKDGDSFFKSVDTTDSEFVIFTLADGTEIKLPTWYAFEQLKTLCNQMNTNIAALQAIINALQNNDYVKSVTPVMQDGKEIGYTITFSKSNPITIYHGQNGKDGANGSDGKDGVNGKDGHTPIIGVRQDADGIYYWTLDSEWLLDEAGNKIKAEGRDGQNGADGKDGQDGANGSDGKDGQDGKDGADGKDGITPQLKIEGGYWYVSTDNGATWAQLGKATGEDGKDGSDGIDGTNGKDGDSFFKSVTQDADNVYFTLADGTKITVPKKSSLAISFDKGTNITFDIDETKTVYYTISGGNSNNVIKAEMQNDDGAYTLHTTSSSATYGSIKISTTFPTVNRVIVSVSEGKHTIMAAIDVALKAAFDGKIISVATPGTLAKLIADYDKTSITELTVIGNLNSSDINTIKSLPNIAILDMENTNIETLPSSTFKNKTSLISVKLPRNLQLLDTDIFYGCSNLENICIQNSVTSIGSNAFNGCSSLTSINIPDGVTLIGWSAFADCSSLTNITIPDSITSIELSAFKGCSSLENITIPDSVTSIGMSAFKGCSRLTNINIPSSVTELGSEAFSGCSGKCFINCNIPDKEERFFNSVFYNAMFTDIIIGNDVTKIGASAFDNCRCLISITIPDSVTSIGNSAFMGCSSLTSIAIPNRVTSIGHYTFSGCRNLKDLNIHNSITSIGASAFQDCSSLTNVTIPDSVTSIGMSAFKGCSSLENISIPSTVINLGYNAFSECSGKCCINCNIPSSWSGIANSYEYAVFYNAKFTDITIGNDVTEIGNEAFCSCSNLTSITIPDSVLSLGNRVFYRCSNLTNIYCMPITPPTIKSSTFEGTDASIQVPTSSVEVYKTAQYWSSYADKIAGYDF